MHWNAFIFQGLELKLYTDHPMDGPIKWLNLACESPEITIILEKTLPRVLIGIQATMNDQF